MSTVYTFVPSPNHVYPDHPERPGRFDLLNSTINSVKAECIEAKPATFDDVSLVHDAQMIQSLEKVCREEAPSVIDFAPTYVTQSSFDDALLAVGGTLACSRAVINGEADNAFALIRPPGHHAEPDHAMGFCLFNNVAIAAKDAVKLGVERVAIIDYDAHHGNGTQSAFLSDEQVGFLSAHQWGIYPGTGTSMDAPHAKKRIVNMPLPVYAGDKVYEQVADRVFKPFIESFKPQILFISVGYDAHWNDPITTLGLSTDGYFMLAKKVMDFANEYCDGKIVFVLEGGYDPVTMANGVEVTFDAMTNSRSRKEANDLSPHKEPDCTARIEEVRKWHGF